VSLCLFAAYKTEEKNNLPGQLTEPLSMILKERPITFAYTPQLTDLAGENATISLE